MQRLLYLLLFFTFSIYAQAQIEISFMDSTSLKADKVYGIDTFSTLYYSSKNNSFHKQTKDTTINYSNFQLGKITSANAFNPLKINLFYKDFNTVVIIDNRLAEVFKIDFNTLQEYRNVSFVSTGFDNTIWIFNQDLQQLELYDYLSGKIRLKTVPLQTTVLDLKSDYNYCYLLTESHLYVYSYFGSLIHKIKNEGYTEMAFSKAHLLLKKGNTLALLPKNDTKIQAIKSINLLINQFLVTNESLYIYNDEKLSRYQLKSQ